MPKDAVVSDPALSFAAAYATAFRGRIRPLDATANAEALRQRFCLPTPEDGTDPRTVIDELIAAAEPGLVGNTLPAFFGWVMGASDTTGVAADWLTSTWGQNAAIYQTAPAAAIAEEAVAGWLLDLLDLPRESSVGFVTGATMAGFVCLAAARQEVLAAAGHDFERMGFRDAPDIQVFVAEDTHVSNTAALRYLGFGEASLVRIGIDAQGRMLPTELAARMAEREGPKIVVATAGHIHTGGFDAFETIAALARTHDAWLHVDGAFGLWARTLSEKAHLTSGIELADSWSVDGHKWLQLPYDSGFAIVRHVDAHRRAMGMSASYLGRDPGDGRNPSEYNPELSRRARGFAAWAVIRKLGRTGIRELVRRHCRCAERLAEAIDRIDGLRVENRVDLNQVLVTAERDDIIERLNARLQQSGAAFVRPAVWGGRRVLRFSIISQETIPATMQLLADVMTG